MTNVITSDPTLADHDVILDVTDDDRYGVLKMKYKVVDSDGLMSDYISCTFYIIPYGDLYWDFPKPMFTADQLDTPLNYTGKITNRHKVGDDNRFDSKNTFINSYISVLSALKVISFTITDIKFNGSCDDVRDTITVGKISKTPTEPVYWYNLRVNADTANVPIIFKPKYQGNYTGSIKIVYSTYGMESGRTSWTDTYQFDAYCGDHGCINLTVGNADLRNGTITLNGTMNINNITIPTSQKALGYTNVIRNTSTTFAVGKWTNIVSALLPPGVWKVDGHCSTQESNNSNGSTGFNKFIFGISTNPSPSITGPTFPTAMWNIFNHVPLAGTCMPNVIASDGTIMAYVNVYVGLKTVGDLSVTGTLMYTRIA
jgi:hypothetical protein